jgi:hypothetical protein
LKYATIVPVYKKGNRKDLSNYRPISILTSLTKIFEKEMYNRLVKHLNVYNLISNNQFGFRANTGTENAIFKLISEILYSLNHKLLISGIFCDLQKAFDYVSHEVLINKLKFCGITNKHCDLYRSYLEGRFQRTSLTSRFNNKKILSKWLKATNGVPQGSVLGPLLFLIYINDLPLTLQQSGVPVLFADDTSVLISHSNSLQFKNKIEIVYMTLNNWFRKKLLSLNTVKTHCINFSTKNIITVERDIRCLDKLITITNQTKFLGLSINSTLTWDKHVYEIISKLNSVCYWIRNIKPYMSLNAMKMVYFSFFHSVMS